MKIRIYYVQMGLHSLINNLVLTHIIFIFLIILFYRDDFISLNVIYIYIFLFMDLCDPWRYDVSWDLCVSLDLLKDLLDVFQYN